jgi:hypothetical protein
MKDIIYNVKEVRRGTVACISRNRTKLLSVLINYIIKIVQLITLNSSHGSYENFINHKQIVTNKHR